MRKFTIITTLILYAGLSFGQVGSGTSKTTYTIKNVGDFDTKKDDMVNVMIREDAQKKVKTMLQMELHNRHRSSVIRTTNLDFSLQLSEIYSINNGFPEFKKNTSENVLVDILAGVFVKITVFPGGKIATIYIKDDNEHYYFPFAPGSGIIYLSIISSFTDAAGNTFGRGLYKFENNSLVLIQKKPNYNLEAKYKSYDDMIDGINRYDGPVVNSDNATLKDENDSNPHPFVMVSQPANPSSVKEPDKVNKDKANDSTTTFSNELGTFTDMRDGRTYKTVKIGNQVVLAENFAYKPETGNYWVFNDDGSNLSKFGYLYDWATAKAIAPKGWHLPAKEEWKAMYANLGNNKSEVYKAVAENGSSGFNALMMGGFRTIDGEYKGGSAIFWSKSEDVEHNASNVLVFAGVESERIFTFTGLSPRCGLGVRLIKDLESNDNSALQNAEPIFELYVKPPRITVEAQPFIVHFFAPYGVFTPVMELRKPVQGFQYALFDVDVVNPGSDTILFCVNDFFAKNQENQQILIDSLIELQEYLPSIAGFPKDGGDYTNLTFKVVLQEGEVRMIPVAENVLSLLELITFKDTKGYWPSRRFKIAPHNHRMFSFLTVIKKSDTSFNVKYKLGNSINVPVY